MPNFIEKLAWTSALAGFVTAAPGQSYSDSQRQYQERQRQHHEQQLEEQRHRDRLVDEDRERLRNRHAPASSPGATGSSDAAQWAVAVALWAAVLAAREPDRDQQQQHVRKSRLGFVYRHCSEQRSLQIQHEEREAGNMRAEGRMRRDAQKEAEGLRRLEQLGQAQLALPAVCQCAAGRALREFSDAEWFSLGAARQQAPPWSTFDSSRLRSVFSPCTTRHRDDRHAAWLLSGR